MSQTSNAVVTRRHLPTAPEGRRKVTVGTIPTRTSKEAVDAAFFAAEAGITRFQYCGESGRTDEEMTQLNADLAAIENNPANSGGLCRKAGFLRREMRRQEERYQLEFTAGKDSGGGGSAQGKARKAAKAAESRELREQLKNGGRRK